MSLAEAPTVYVIAGANGAGKTTFATEFLPKVIDCPQFLNADLIAAGLSPLAPETQNIRAGRILLERFHELSEAKSDFGFETTLAGRSYARILKSLRGNGYRVHAYFLWLPTADLAVARVANRVQQGGHSVPEVDIRRRFAAGIRNLFVTYRSIFDVWRLYDASSEPPELIVQEAGAILKVLDEQRYEIVVRQSKG